MTVTGSHLELTQSILIAQFAQVCCSLSYCYSRLIKSFYWKLLPSFNNSTSRFTFKFFQTLLFTSTESRQYLYSNTFDNSAQINCRFPILYGIWINKWCPNCVRQYWAKTASKRSCSFFWALDFELFWLEFNGIFTVNGLGTYQM